jgi:hypothetical protein
LILPLGAIGCSRGQSPTEPAVDLEAAQASSTSTASVTEESRRGRGSDYAAGDDNGGRRGRGRGADDDAGDDRGGRRGRRNDRNDDGAQRPRAGQEFEARVVSVDTGAGTLTLAGGTTVVVNGSTQWSARGDLLSLTEVAGSVQRGAITRVEGRGTRQANGTIVAQTIKAEVDRR